MTFLEHIQNFLTYHGYQITDVLTERLLKIQSPLRDRINVAKEIFEIGEWILDDSFFREVELLRAGSKKNNLTFEEARDSILEMHNGLVEYIASGKGIEGLEELKEVLCSIPSCKPKVYHTAVRWALTGEVQGFPIHEVSFCLGIEETLLRLKGAVTHLDETILIKDFLNKCYISKGLTVKDKPLEEALKEFT